MGELKKPCVNKIVMNHPLTCIVICMLQNKHNKNLHIIPEIIPWISLIIHITYDLLTNTHILNVHMSSYINNDHL